MEIVADLAKAGSPPSQRSADGAARASSRLKSLSFRVFAIASGIIVALGAIEIGLRVAGWPAPGLYVNGRGPIELRAAGRNGGAYPPGIRGQMNHYDYSVDWEVNNFGFRDGDVGAKRSDEWRIGFLGDSFTAGVGVRQQERFTDLFSRELGRDRPNVTVWNLAAPLCGTACETAMLEGATQAYQFDEVVLAFYGGNDLEDNSSWFATGSETSPKADRPGLATETRNWLRQHSRSASFVWVTGVRGWASFRPPGIFARADLDRYWLDTERSLRLFRGAVGARRFTILYLPSTPEWDESVWQIMRSRYHAADDSRHLVRDAVAEWSRRDGVTFIDATEWLQKCPPDASCVFPVDPHWTAKAHSLVAQGLLNSTRWTKIEP
jgi:GDSL-like Lipase/Acylhydrolase family